MEKYEEIKEALAEYNEDMLFADGFDEALIGCVSRCGELPVALYDEDKCIEILMEEGLTVEEALDHFEYNVRGSYVGENTPAFTSLLKNMII